MDSAQGGHAPDFVQENMASVAQQHFISALAKAEHADEVSHGATGNKESRLLAGFFCGQGFQFFKGRVFFENIIPDFGIGLASRIAGVGWVNVSLLRSIMIFLFQRDAGPKVQWLITAGNRFLCFMGHCSFSPGVARSIRLRLTR